MFFLHVNIEPNLARETSIVMGKKRIEKIALNHMQVYKYLICSSLKSKASKIGNILL